MLRNYSEGFKGTKFQYDVYYIRSFKILYYGMHFLIIAFDNCLGFSDKQLYVECIIFRF